jgi:hypothetical protein
VNRDQGEELTGRSGRSGRNGINHREIRESREEKGKSIHGDKEFGS